MGIGPYGEGLHGGSGPMWASAPTAGDSGQIARATIGNGGRLRAVPTAGGCGRSVSAPTAYLLLLTSSVRGAAGRLPALQSGTADG